MVNILPRRKTLISPQQHLRLIANNLNSTNTKNQMLASITLIEIEKKVVSPVECQRQASDDKSYGLHGRHAVRHHLHRGRVFSIITPFCIYYLRRMTYRRDGVVVRASAS